MQTDLRTNFGWKLRLCQQDEITSIKLIFYMKCFIHHKYNHLQPAHFHSAVYTDFETVLITSKSRLWKWEREKENRNILCHEAEQYYIFISCIYIGNVLVNTLRFSHLVSINRVSIVSVVFIVCQCRKRTKWRWAFLLQSSILYKRKCF